jgi:hypothetical protein
MLWTIVWSLSAAGSAFFAGWQIKVSRRDSNRRAVLDHLREVEHRLEPLYRDGDLAQARADLPAQFKGESPTDLGLRYMSFLIALDLLS